VPPAEVSAGHLSSVLSALPRGKAGGRYGWTYERVNAAADNGLAAFEAILKRVNAMVAGRLPHLGAFLGSNLIAMEKSGG
jgi:hypothetical protein